jgi:hypothetical protein
MLFTVKYDKTVKMCQIKLINQITNLAAVVAPALHSNQSVAAAAVEVTQVYLQ